jgi:hypothetical protein
MKKQLLYFLSATLGITGVHAQVTLTKTLPPVGAISTLHQTPSASLARPVSGENVTWDYSAITPSAQFVFEVKALTSIGQQFRDSCPTAKFVEVLNMSGAPSPDHLPMDFYEDKGDYLVKVGSKGSNLNFERKNDTLFAFNLAYGSGAFYQGATRTYAGYGTFKIGAETLNDIVLIKARPDGANDTSYFFFRVTPYWSRIASIGFNNGQSTGIAYWKTGTAPTTGLSQTAENANLNLYPNPATSELLIQSGQTITAAVISDIHGREVLRISNPQKAIAIDYLENGVYLITLHTEHFAVTRKFIKN